LYKESAVSNVWNLLGNISYDSLGVFIDPNSTPNIKPERYAISIVDSCGNESVRSPSHRTMHLTVNQGQTANDWNLIWNAYEGFTAATYRIYRADSTMNFIKIDSIAGSSSYTYLFTDYGAPSGPLYYMVEIVHPNGGCGISKANTNYNTSRSNTASNGIQPNVSLIPEFSADVTTGVVPLVVTFTDQTTNGTVNSYYWSFGDGTFSADQNPVHQYISEGVYQVVLTVQNEHGEEHMIKDAFIDVLPNGVISLNSDFDIKVFPNPYKGKTNIAYALVNKTDVKIEVYNSLGELVTIIVNEKQTSGSYKYQFSARNYGYAQGVYYLRVTLDDRVINKRLIEVK
jgi:PKD repeat protein